MKRIVVSTGMAVLLVLGSLGVLLAEDWKPNDDAEQDRIQTGFRIAPVRLRYNPQSRELVGLGSYIVNAQGGCNDCHTAPPYTSDPHLGQPEKINVDGYLAGGQFFGPFESPNITPDPDNKLPAGLTFNEFKDVMRTGVDPGHRQPPLPPLLQVMPWPIYGKMNDHDLRAIYEYLKAIPHADTPVPGAATRQP
jgi:hypothetical protein